MQLALGRNLLAVGLGLCVSCGDDTSGPDLPSGPPETGVDASAVQPGDAGVTPTLDAAAAMIDTGTAPLLDAGAGADGRAAVDATPPLDSQVSPFDASGVKAPTVQDVVRILSRRCGDCHQNEGSDGFVFDGRLRSTLLDAVEAAATPLGELPGAAACRREKRIQRGDPNSYLIRKVELYLGRSPQPTVCGEGMPRALILEPEEKAQLAVELEQLKLWIVNGAPLQ